MNDITGPMKPYDMLYVGKDATVFGDLTVWNWAIWDSIRKLPGTVAASFDDQDIDDIGTLMMTEGYAYHLWLQYPHFRKAAMADGNMPPGRHFINTFLIGPHKESPGTKANTVHVQFYAWQKYDPSTGRMKLGDNDMAGVPSVPPVSPLG